MFPSSLGINTGVFRFPTLKISCLKLADLYILLLLIILFYYLYVTELLGCRLQGSPSGVDRLLDELGASMAFPCGYVLARETTTTGLCYSCTE